MVVGVVVTLAITGCRSDPEEADYGPENREAFLTACTDGATDPSLVRDICECAYDEISTTYGLAELAELEASLAIDSLAPLPDVIAVSIADCFVAEADL